MKKYWIYGALVCLPLLQGCLAAATVGVAGTAMFLDDRRSGERYVADENIELKAANIISERYGFDVHVSVVAFAGLALIAGQVPSQQIKGEIAALVQGLAGVRQTYDELTVGPLSSFGTRSDDAYITSKVKARFFDTKTLNANHVKVFTESGVVYLLGIVTAGEADTATEVARTTTGVKRVVRIFELVQQGESKK